MKTIAAYIFVIGLFAIQAVRMGGHWYEGVLVVVCLFIFLLIGDWFLGLFDSLSTSTRRPRVKKQPIFSQKLLKEEIPVYDGEVVDEDFPPLCATNPLPLKRIANQKTDRSGGGVYIAIPMWCDKCRHYPLHIQIDGAWVCQCPWHDQ